jgi:hypothetical protein
MLVSSPEFLGFRGESGAKAPHSKALRAKHKKRRNEAGMLLKTKVTVHGLAKVGLDLERGPT